MRTVRSQGRIIGAEGRVSGQVDVLVLKDSYPEKLLSKKLYLAAGVAAAFECKTTLKAAHIEKAVKTGVEIKSLYPRRKGTPYQELHSSVLYGLLAHSHAWKAPSSVPEDTISKVLRHSDEQYIQHLRDTLDLLCVADLTTWTDSKMTLPGAFPETTDMPATLGQQGIAISSYGRMTSGSRGTSLTPIGRLISYLSMRIAWEDPSLRSLASYYRAVGLDGNGGGEYRTWDPWIYSDEVRHGITAGRLSSGNAVPWDEWSYIYF